MYVRYIKHETAKAIFSSYISRWKNVETGGLRVWKEKWFLRFDERALCCTLSVEKQLCWSYLQLQVAPQALNRIFLLHLLANYLMIPRNQQTSILLSRIKKSKGLKFGAKLTFHSYIINLNFQNIFILYF